MAGQMATVQALLDGYPGVGLVLGGDGVILWANPEALQAFAEAPAAQRTAGFAGCLLHEILPCALGARILHHLRRRARAPQPEPVATRFQLALDRRDEPPCRIDVTLWPVRPAREPLVWIVQIAFADPATGGDAEPARFRCTAARAQIDAEHARQQAQDNADILRIATEHSTVVPWYRVVSDPAGWIGPQFAAMLGYRPDQVVDLPALSGLIHPDDLAGVLKDVMAMEQGEIPACCHDYRVRRADGDWAWVTVRGRRVDRAAQGLPDMFCGSLTDISERKETEERLAKALAEAERTREQATEREELLRTSGRCAQVGHFSLCPALGEGWTPDETYRLFGYEPGELPATEAGWRSLIHPDDLPGAVAAIEALKDNKSPLYVHEHRRRHKDGSYHWYRAIARRVDRADKGLPYLLAGAIIGIDHVKENELRLAEEARNAERARARLDTLADNAPGALFEYRLDRDGQVVLPYFSAKLPAMLGVTRAAIEADGAAVFTHVAPDILATITQQVLASRDAGTPFEARFPIRHPEHGARWLAVSSLPFVQSDASTLWFGTVFDVTDQVVMVEQAEKAAQALRKAHDRMLTMAENVPGALFEWFRTAEGRSHFALFSNSLPEILGLSRAALQADGTALYTHILPEDRPLLQGLVAQSEATMTRLEARFRVQHPVHGLRWIALSASPFSRAGEDVVWYGHAIDITERIEAKHRAAEAAAEVHQAHERLALIASIAPVGLYEFKRAADGTATFPYASPYFEDLLGVGYGLFAKATAAEGMFANVHPDDLPDFLTGNTAPDAKLEVWNQRFRVRHPLRGEIWLANSATPKAQSDGSMVWTGALYDVTQDVQREAELRRAHRLAEEMRAENERQALHDGLTGLPNRRYYDQVLSRHIAAAAAGGPRDCALIRLDLDHFKYVNDTLGHEAGDMVLQRVATVLRATLRGVDFAARIGGDEFSIILGTGTGREQAREVVERIQTHLAEPLMFEGRQCRFGASFGLALTEDIVAMGPEIQLFADAALYRAKTGGRNRMELFTPELHRNLLFDRRLAVEIQEGLERGEFEPFFQPQVSAVDGRMTGIETLLRWRHPDRGLLAPNAFMHVAEQLRLVPEIDRVMMERSRVALDLWRRQGLEVPKISFNVSSGRMHDPDVVRAAQAIAKDATKVTFELLESILVEEESDVFRFHLDAIREAGIDIEIDDFGSGHASIIGLMEIAPSALKIDQRIVAPVARDLRARNLVRAIIEIAETLGIATVAEGVETEAQAAILRDLGCDVLQGYLFSVPLSAKDFAAYCNVLRKTG